MPEEEVKALNLWSNIALALGEKRMSKKDLVIELV